MAHYGCIGNCTHHSLIWMWAGQEGAAAMRPLYPALDSKPLAPNQYGNVPQGNNNSQSLMDADARPPFSAAQPSPSLELQLGPQEMPVSSIFDTSNASMSNTTVQLSHFLPGIHATVPAFAKSSWQACGLETAAPHQSIHLLTLRIC